MAELQSNMACKWSSMGWHWLEVVWIGPGGHQGRLKRFLCLESGARWGEGSVGMFLSCITSSCLVHSPQPAKLVSSYKGWACFKSAFCFCFLLAFCSLSASFQTVPNSQILPSVFFQSYSHFFLNPFYSVSFFNSFLALRQQCKPYWENSTHSTFKFYWLNSAALIVLS